MDIIYIMTVGLVYVYMYVCLVCWPRNLNKCVNKRDVLIYMYIHTYINTYIYTHTCILAYIPHDSWPGIFQQDHHRQIHRAQLGHLHTYIHACMHTYIYTHTCIHTS